MDAESYASWRGFLEDLRTLVRIVGARCATSDAHEGSEKAISECFPGAARQRCIARLERNACSLPKTRRHRAMACKAMQAAFEESDPVKVREAHHVAIDEIGEFCTAAADLPEEAEADASACPGFPVAHRRRLRTDNVQERANREIERRSRAAQAFPSAKSPIRLVGAVRCKIDEDWSSRCCIAPESLAVLNEEGKAPDIAEATEEHKQRTIRPITVAMESADAKGRAA